MCHNKHILVFTALFVALLATLTGFIQTHVIGQPTQNREFLIKIQRSLNADEVFYDIKLDDAGFLELPDPIEIYWVRHTQQGIIERLSWLERRFAYGVKYIELRPDYVSFYFVSKKEMVFYIRRDWQLKYKLYTFLDGVKTEATGIIVYFTMRFYGFPKIEKVEIYGINISTSEDMLYIVRP